MRGAWDTLYRRGEPYHGPAAPPSFTLPASARVLDLGCGAGKSLRALPRGAVGLDASRPALARARPLPVVQGDARALPVRGAAFDAVRAVHLFAHLGPGERADAAREAERVLRPGGFLEVREVARGDLRDHTGRDLGGATFERGGIATHYFASGELAALFARCDGAERVVERAVRFARRPRRVVVLRARRRA